MQNPDLLTTIISLFYKHQLKIKTYHFQTKLYGAHKTSDKYLKKFRNNLDRFIKVAQDIPEFGRLGTQIIDVNFETLADANIAEDLHNFIAKITCDIYPKITKYSDLTTIMDEIIADTHQFIYLLQFR